MIGQLCVIVIIITYSSDKEINLVYTLVNTTTKCKVWNEVFPEYVSSGMTIYSKIKRRVQIRNMWLIIIKSHQKINLECKKII